jgi:hypothetical protein
MPWLIISRRIRQDGLIAVAGEIGPHVRAAASFPGAAAGLVELSSSGRNIRNRHG